MTLDYEGKLLENLGLIISTMKLINNVTNTV